VPDNHKVCDKAVIVGSCARQPALVLRSASFQITHSTIEQIGKDEKVRRGGCCCDETRRSKKKDTILSSGSRRKEEAILLLIMNIITKPGLQASYVPLLLLCAG
jgi:hypothetical protein